MNVAFEPPQGLIWYALLTCLGGLVAWMATKYGVLAAFRLEEETRERDRVRRKYSLIQKMINEFEMARRGLEGFVNNSQAFPAVSFPVFQGTVDLQVELFQAVDPTFLKVMHAYYERFQEKAARVQESRHGGPDEDDPARQEHVQDARALIQLIDEVIGLLKREMSDREMQILSKVDRR